MATIVESKKIEKENCKEKKASKYQRIVYLLACYSIFSNGMSMLPSNRIVLAVLIGTVLVYSSISLYLAFKVRKKKKGYHIKYNFYFFILIYNKI